MPNKWPLINPVHINPRIHGLTSMNRHKAMKSRLKIPDKTPLRFPLVNVYIAIENHHFETVNPL